jgi:hypothetical protein
MSLRPGIALLTVSAVLTLAACTSSSSGKGNGTSSGAAPSSTVRTVSAAQLASKLESSLGRISSAKFTLNFTIGTTAVSGSGAEQLNRGKLVALKVSEVSAGGTNGAELIIVGGKTYAKLPASVAKTTKPYVLVTPNSKNPLVRALAPQLTSALTSASLGSVNEFVRAAKSIQDKGAQRVDGVPTTHYTVLVDITKLPAQLQRDLGGTLTTLPLEIYLDSQDRPVLYTESATLQGQKESVRVTLSDFNKPVTISPPPAGQVGTS